MKKPRKIIVHIATSADGYIARPDGDVAWLDRPRPKGNYGMSAFVKSIDTILMGYETYAKGLEMGMKSSGFGPKIKNYVFSRHPRDSPLPTFEFVNEPVKPFAQRLPAQPGKHIWTAPRLLRDWSPDFRRARSAHGGGRLELALSFVGVVFARWLCRSARP